MKRYRGVDKPPGPTLSPPPYSRNAGNKTNTLNSAGSRGSNTRFSTTAASGPIPDHDLMMIRGSGAAASFLDPRTKKPVIPQAGRSIPKLKMADLTCSLAPLVESQMIPEVELLGPPSSGKGRKLRGAVSAKTSLKAIPSNDLLESFDSAIRVPDMRTINSKVGHMRKVTSLGGKVNVAPIPSKNHSVPKLKSSGKMEEQNMKRLMGQLRDKYLEDMESQLGLAVE
ncbi:unnamed protein product [Orchesella dallaii]|uniref:Uncharacterized protein n=1 Tax=Orchesella dallaii TaxID=48710 RepID=A0ABP1R7A6_9HEXA